MIDPKVKKAIKTAAKRKSATPLIEKAAFAATLVETGGKNLNYGDRDSVGAFQQRPSMGWKGLTNPTKAAEEFMDAAKTVVRKNPNIKSGDLAQAVQRSGYPARYSAHDIQKLAQNLLKGGSSDTTTTMKTTPMSYTNTSTPETTQASKEKAVQMVLASGHKVGLPKLGSGGRLAQVKFLLDSGQANVTTPAAFGGKSTPGTSSVKTTGSKSHAAPKGLGSFIISGPDPKRLKPELVAFARKVAGQAGEALTGLDGSTHSKMTVNGNVSEHYTGNATDIPAKGTRLVHLGQAALIAAGMPRAEALKQHGGLYNVGNHQIIFNTQEGGDHTDHLHISSHAKR